VYKNGEVIVTVAHDHPSVSFPLRGFDSFFCLFWSFFLPVFCRWPTRSPTARSVFFLSLALFFFLSVFFFPTSSPLFSFHPDTIPVPPYTTFLFSRFCFDVAHCLWNLVPFSLVFGIPPGLIPFTDVSLNLARNRVSPCSEIPLRRQTPPFFSLPFLFQFLIQKMPRHPFRAPLLEIPLLPVLAYDLMFPPCGSTQRPLYDLPAMPPLQSSFSSVLPFTALFPPNPCVFLKSPFFAICVCQWVL